MTYKLGIYSRFLIKFKYTYRHRLYLVEHKISLKYEHRKLNEMTNYNI